VAGQGRGEQGDPGAGAEGAGPRDLAGVLSRAVRRVEAGELEPNRATALATLARALVGAWQAGEAEERLRRLEVAAGLEPAG
jgi:hypothetical protein